MHKGVTAASCYGSSLSHSLETGAGGLAHSEGGWQGCSCVTARTVSYQCHASLTTRADDPCASCSPCSACCTCLALRLALCGPSDVGAV